MKMKKILTTLLLTTAMFAGTANLAYAQQYGDGDGVDRKISIDKKVYNPKTEEYVDNLSASQYVFGPDQPVWFQITVTNTGDGDINEAETKDNLPSYLYLDSSTDRFTDSFKINETKIYYVVGRVYERDRLADGVHCVTNEAISEFDYEDEDEDGDDKTYRREDTAQICIDAGKEVTEVEKEIEPVLGFRVLPEAGPFDNSLVLAISALMAMTGGALIRKKH